jgi:hypothetical protein
LELSEGCAISASRLAFAYARDGLLPASKVIATVNKRVELSFLLCASSHPTPLLPGKPPITFATVLIVDERAHWPHFTPGLSLNANLFYIWPFIALFAVELTSSIHSIPFPRTYTPNKIDSHADQRLHF